MAGAASQARYDVAEPDDQIIVTFQAWVDAVRAYASYPADEPEIAFEALVDVADRISAQIATMPASGIDGLAIKTYLAMRLQFGTDWTDFGIDWGGLKDANPLEKSLLADLVRACPLLREVLPGHFVSTASQIHAVE